jgi:VIT1/CCC1 family predicted Fe2+/Mn2+ transporter
MAAIQCKRGFGILIVEDTLISDWLSAYFGRSVMGLADYIGKFWTGAEVMYGVIIAMTFTSVLRGYPNILEIILNQVILAALFCCIAWGVADGLFYLWERNYIIRRENKTIELAKSEEGDDSAISLIGEQLDDTILRNIPGENRVQLYQKLTRFLSTVDEREKLSPGQAFTIILGTFLLSSGAGLVVVFPFFVIDNVTQALVLSNISGILLLFIVGYSRAFERNSLSRIINGFASAFIGIIISVITVILGG